MNEWEKLLQSFYTRMVDRISTMTEAQVLGALRAIKASRNSNNEMLAFLNSVAVVPSQDSDDEINKLRSQLSSRTRSSDSGLDPMDYVDGALNKRLERLRKRGE